MEWYHWVLIVGGIVFVVGAFKLLEAFGKGMSR